jgi:hypothetical protein
LYNLMMDMKIVFVEHPLRSFVNFMNVTSFFLKLELVELDLFGWKKVSKVFPNRCLEFG